MNILKLNPVNDKIMWDIWMSSYHMSSLTVADELGLFNSIKKRKNGIKTLANNLKVNERGLISLTNVLSALGFINKRNSVLTLNPYSTSYLLSDSPFYWGAQFKQLCDRTEHKRLLNALRNSTTELTFNNESFSNMWENGSLTAPAADDFTNKMHATIFAPALNAIKSGIFSTTKKLLDIGGGSGCLSVAFTKKYPQSCATVLELPQVCDITSKYLKAFNAKNVEIISSNFFLDQWPKGFDGILFSQIFHDWPLAQCKFLAKQAYNALPLNGKIYIHEMFLDTNEKTPLTVACFDLLMFMNHQSQQFTKTLLTTILKDVGFKNFKFKRTFGYYSILTAQK
jgi:hypothetical protein